VILPDVNVLIYAFRRDAPHHEQCRHWLADVIANDARFGISPLVLNSVIRITTDHRVFKVPSGTDEAFAFCDELLSQAHCQPVEPGERHWSIFRRLCTETGTRGSRVTDAWFAALAIEAGCEWITFDRDFGRFSGLKWRTPGRDS